MKAEEFLKYVEEERKRMGFKDDWEFFAVAQNWKEVFGKDLPKDYYHSRDKDKLFDGMAGVIAESDKIILRNRTHGGLNLS